MKCKWKQYFGVALQAKYSGTVSHPMDVQWISNMPTRPKRESGSGFRWTFKTRTADWPLSLPTRD